MCNGEVICDDILDMRNEIFDTVICDNILDIVPIDNFSMMFKCEGIQSDDVDILSNIFDNDILIEKMYLIGDCGVLWARFRGGYHKLI